MKLKQLIKSIICSIFNHDNVPTGVDDKDGLVYASMYCRRCGTESKELIRGVRV